MYSPLKTNELILTNQSVTASGNSLLVNGVLVSGGGSIDTGSFATISYVTGASGVLSDRLISTGSYLFGLINASSAGVSSINSLSGAMTFLGAGNVSVTGSAQTIYFSGDTGAYGNFIGRGESGQFASAINLSNTGASLISLFAGPSGRLIKFNGTGIESASIRETGGIVQFGITNSTGLFSGIFHINSQGALLWNSNNLYPIGSAINHPSTVFCEFVTCSNQGAADNWNANSYYSWGSATRIAYDTGNTLTQRNALNPQTYRIHSAYVNSLTGSWLEFQATTGAQFITTVSSGTGLIPLRLGVNRSGTIIITTGGNVGINNSNPQYTLDVDGSIKATQSGIFEILSTNGLYVSGQSIVTGSVVRPNETGGFTSVSVTGSVLRTYSNFSGWGGTFVFSSGDFVLISGDTRTDTLIAWTGSSTGLYYPLNGNPSGFITNQQTGAFQPLLGFVPLNKAGDSSTGNYYFTGSGAHYYVLTGLAQNPLPSIVLGNTTLATTGVPTQESPSIVFSGQGWVSGSPTDFGSQLSTWRVYGKPLSGAILSSELRIDAALNTGISGQVTYFNVVTLNTTGNSGVNINGNGYLSGNRILTVLDTGVLINTSQTGQFASSINLFNTGSNLQGQINTITSWTGTADANYVNHSETGQFASSINLFNTGSNLQSQITTITNWTGTADSIYVNHTETGQFASDVDVSNVQSQVTTLNNWTGTTTGLYYPYTANPANYVKSSETGTFASISVTGSSRRAYSDFSGYAGIYIFTSGNQVIVSGGAGGSGLSQGVADTLYYPLNSNPSGYFNLDSKSIYLENPVSGDRINFFWTSNQLTIKRVKSVVYTTGSSPSVTFRLTQSSMATGISGLIMSGYTETGRGSGTLTTGFANSIVTGGNFVFLECSGAVNTNYLHVTVEYQS